MIDIILQGPLYEYTNIIVENYVRLPFVNNIIISCWETCPDYKFPPKTIIVRNKDVEYPGIGNRNRQIKSSLEGLKKTDSEFSVKLRTDQLIYLESMIVLYNFYLSNCNTEIKYTNNKGPYNKIGVHGICKDFPFHPIDHIYWGNTNDLIEYFNIEYDSAKVSENTTDSQFNHYIRSETYITLPYVSKFDERVKKFREDVGMYFYDNSPKKLDALQVSHELMDKIFLVFPKIKLEWPKYGMYQYHYDVMETERGGHAYWSDKKI